MIADTATEPTSGGHMTIWEHLAELRSRIFKVRHRRRRRHGRRLVRLPVPARLPAGAVQATSRARTPASSPPSPLAGLHPAAPDVALHRHRRRHAGDPVAALAVRHPGLYPHEKKYAIPFVGQRAACCSSSAPPSPTTPSNPALEFLVNIGGPDIEPLYTPRQLRHPHRLHDAGLRRRASSSPCCSWPSQLARRASPPAACSAGGGRRSWSSSWSPRSITPSGDPISMIALAVPDGAASTACRSASARCCSSSRASAQGDEPRRPTPSTPTAEPHRGGRAAGRSTGHGPSLGAVTDTADRGFALDRFQIEAIAALDAGRVGARRAPTGSGKTVVAEHAVAVALAAGGQAFYTTPIKALSNQKYHDLVRRHGADRVGLLTGDNADQRRRPGGRDDHRGAAQHDLQPLAGARAASVRRARRGALPPGRLPGPGVGGGHHPPPGRACAWCACRPRCRTPPSWPTGSRPCGARPRWWSRTRRPVELDNLVPGRGPPGRADGTCSRRWSTARPNPDGSRFDTDAPRRVAPGRGGGRPRRRYATPRRLDVVDLLGRAGPAAGDLLHLQPGRLRRRRHARASAPGCASPSREERAPDPRDRRAPRAPTSATTTCASSATTAGSPRLEAGVAAHHAGMVPPFKEAVEACFVEGLVKVVFATETLALGINMPARTVVIEKLTKFTGERHEFLTPGQYTQLTGRAGRRGIDDHGHAVVLWSPFVTFGEVAGLAASRSFRLTSARSGPPTTWPPTWCAGTRPTRPTTCSTCRFAQYQADAEVVRLEQRLAQRRERLDDLRGRGRLRAGRRGRVPRRCSRASAAAEGRAAGRPGQRRRGRPARPCAPGDVLWLDGSGGARPGGRALGVAPQGRRRCGCEALTAHRRVLEPRRGRLRRSRPRSSAHLALPDAVHAHDSRRSSSRSPPTERFAAGRRGPGGAAAIARAGPGRPGVRPPASTEVDRSALLDHPVARLPRPRRPPPGRCAGPSASSASWPTPSGRSDSRTGSLVDTFDRVLQLLEAWGYLDGWALTARGERLVRIYHECDLLIAEALEEGLFDDLDPDAARRPGLVPSPTSTATPAPTSSPGSRTRRCAGRADRLTELAVELNADEQRSSACPPTRVPDAGLLRPGPRLGGRRAASTTCSATRSSSGGDFVRNVKQLVDLLRQIGDAAADRTTASTARRAADAVLRGVVSARRRSASARGDPRRRPRRHGRAAPPTPRRRRPGIDGSPRAAP